MKIQTFSDQTAIGLSFVCLLHCLALPVFIVFFPSLALNTLSDEAFHQWLLYAILPISVVALSAGFMHHRNLSVLAISCLGLTILVGTGFLDHEAMGERIEVFLTVLGSVIIAYGHFKNSKLRKLFLSQKT